LTVLRLHVVQEGQEVDDSLDEDTVRVCALFRGRHDEELEVRVVP
jgi:hypothetical protein